MLAMGELCSGRPSTPGDASPVTPTSRSPVGRGASGIKRSFKQLKRKLPDDFPSPPFVADPDSGYEHYEAFLIAQESDYCENNASTYCVKTVYPYGLWNVD
ncbi:unnamed protein product [Penicillium salamii]|nr:unnamed protein product [Penicillium salamii]